MASSAAPPPPTPQAQPHTTFNVYLSSYEEACLLDTDLQSFDVTIQAGTNSVISSLATGVQPLCLHRGSGAEVILYGRISFTPCETLPCELIEPNLDVRVKVNHQPLRVFLKKVLKLIRKVLLKHSPDKHQTGQYRS
ncbi:UPF0496 protein At4g34320-like [Fagus crenata]